ncbi:unnamed protein product [Eruca vesicaria subsp. sativa]|uniref:Uncharacterized protein n=1 Tax=Eruca vesicaria subsp. sativa TaxID=29727 RepID=A0ABC8KGL9_ERUVS|nr:unnamed protein product [Eruca vesicaria subsp. sativa]
MASFDDGDFPAHTDSPSQQDDSFISITGKSSCRAYPAVLNPEVAAAAAPGEEGEKHVAEDEGAKAE